MKEMIVNIPEESSTLVTELVKKLGGSVKPARKKSATKRKNLIPRFYLANGKTLILMQENLEKNYGEENFS